MIRIVGVERSQDPYKEAVLMQNQGVMRVNLKGHALLAASDEQGDLREGFAYVFTEDVELPAGTYVWVLTAGAQTGWFRTKEGYHVYRTSLRKLEPVWSSDSSALHLLAPQHTFVVRERTVAASAI